MLKHLVLGLLVAILSGLFVISSGDAKAQGFSAQTVSSTTACSNKTAHLRPAFNPWELSLEHHYYLAVDFAVNSHYVIYNLTHPGIYKWAIWNNNYPKLNVTRFGVSTKWLFSSQKNWNMFWNDKWVLIYC